MTGLVTNAFGEWLTIANLLRADQGLGRLTYDEIQKATGIAVSTLSRLNQGKNVNYRDDVIARLVIFFQDQGVAQAGVETFLKTGPFFDRARDMMKGE